VFIKPDAGLTPEAVAGKWTEINDLSKAKPYGNAMEAAGAAMKGAF
jgi:hypothetical protein